MITFMSISSVIAFKWMVQEPTDDEVNIGLGNGLVPSSKRPLPEPLLT